MTVTASKAKVAPAILSRLFEPCAETSQHIDGWGVRMAIGQQIILAHGGKITVTSTADTDIMFTVQLPGAAGGRTETAAEPRRFEVAL